MNKEIDVLDVCCSAHKLDHRLKCPECQTKSRNFEAFKEDNRPEIQSEIDSFEKRPLTRLEMQILSERGAEDLETVKESIKEMREHFRKLRNP